MRLQGHAKQLLQSRKAGFQGPLDLVPTIRRVSFH